MSSICTLTPSPVSHQTLHAAPQNLRTPAQASEHQPTPVRPFPQTLLRRTSPLAQSTAETAPQPMPRGVQYHMIPFVLNLTWHSPKLTVAMKDEHPRQQTAAPTSAHRRGQPAPISPRKKRPRLLAVQAMEPAPASPRLHPQPLSLRQEPRR